MSTDLTFITNEAGKHLRDRFGVLLGDDTPTAANVVREPEKEAEKMLEGLAQ